MIMTKEKAVELLQQAQNLVNEVYCVYGGEATTSALSSADSCIDEALNFIDKGI
jgi:hypothetical protein